MSAAAGRSVPSPLAVTELSPMTGARVPAKPRGWKKWTRRISRAFKGKKKNRRPQGQASSSTDIAQMDNRSKRSKNSNSESPALSENDIDRQHVDSRQQKLRDDRTLEAVDLGSGIQLIDEESEELDQYNASEELEHEECELHSSVTEEFRAGIGGDDEQHLAGPQDESYDFDDPLDDELDIQVVRGSDDEGSECVDRDQYESTQSEHVGYEEHDDELYSQCEDHHERPCIEYGDQTIDNTDDLVQEGNVYDEDSEDNLDPSYHQLSFTEDGGEDGAINTAYAVESEGPILECSGTYDAGPADELEFIRSTRDIATEQVRTATVNMSNIDAEIPYELVFVRNVASWCYQQGTGFDSTCQLFLSCISRQKWELASHLALLIKRGYCNYPSSLTAPAVIVESTLQDILRQCTG